MASASLVPVASYLVELVKLRGVCVVADILKLY